MRGRERVQLVVVRHVDATDGGLDRLGPSDRSRLDAASPPVRARFLAGREAALDAARRLLGADAAALPLSIDATCPDCGGAHGRPIVSADARVVHVSIAHAAHRAFAVAAFVPVGVDAEPRNTPRARLTAVGRLIGRRVADPLATWTRIEAVLKADGRGLRVDPRDVVLGWRRAHVRDRETRYRVHVRRDVEGCTVAIARSDAGAARRDPVTRRVQVVAAATAAPHRTATRRTGRPARHP